MIPWRRHPIRVSPELAALFASEAEYFWGYEGGATDDEPVDER